MAFRYYAGFEEDRTLIDAGIITPEEASRRARSLEPCPHYDGYVHGIGWDCDGQPDGAPLRDGEDRFDQPDADFVVRGRGCQTGTHCKGCIYDDGKVEVRKLIPGPSDGAATAWAVMPPPGDVIDLLGEPLTPDSIRAIAKRIGGIDP